MRSEIMGHCWANFSVIYGMTFGQEESSILICNNVSYLVTSKLALDY